MNKLKHEISSGMPSVLAKLLEKGRKISQLDLKRLTKAAEELDSDPEWQAEYLKGLFVEGILAALEETEMSQSDIAAKWGKSRQYVNKLLNEDRRVNFTIETMCQVAHLLNRRIQIQVLPVGDNSVGKVIPSNRDSRPDSPARNGRHRSTLVKKQQPGNVGI